jgi:hypothetical protein
MSIYITDTTIFNTLFEFDCELKEQKKIKVRWTKHAIETGAEVSRYGILEEKEYRAEGIVTAWPLVGSTTRNLLRVIQIDKALEAIAEAKQPVVLFTGWWTPTVVIDDVDSSSGPGDGEAQRIAIEFHTITLPQPVYTTIPPSHLKPSVRKGSSAPKRGGAQTGVDKPKPDESWLTQLFGAIKR